MKTVKIIPLQALNEVATGSLFLQGETYEVDADRAAKWEKDNLVTIVKDKTDAK